MTEMYRRKKKQARAARDAGPSPAGDQWCPAPQLKSVLPHFTFGPPVATYIQYCILKMLPPFLVFGPPAAKSWRPACRDGYDETTKAKRTKSCAALFWCMALLARRTRYDDTR